MDERAEVREQEPLLAQIPARSSLSPHRVIAAWLLAVIGVPVLTVVFVQVRPHAGLPSVPLVYLLLIVFVASVGGIWPALVAAVSSSFVVNWYFTPPFYTLSIRHPQNVLALAVFIVAAIVVSALVSVAARRSHEAARARSEAEAIARGAATLVGRDDPVSALMESLRETFGLEAIALLRSVASGWRVEAHAGTPCPTTPEQGDAEVKLSRSTRLVMVGSRLTSDDRRVLQTFTAPVLAALETRRLQAEASAAQKLAAQNELRAALLAAVSHDLRTPLSSIKASVTSLLQDEVEWSPDATREFLETIDNESDRLNKIVGNLLDMTRIQTGGVDVSKRDIGLDEVVAVALANIGSRARGVDVEVPEDLPSVRADAALLERAIGNLIDNALIHARVPVRIVGTSLDGRVHLRVIDRGPGIPEPDREVAFRPFQRLGDRPEGVGVGLGLAVARGFVEAMGGELTLDDTPGGGLTVDIALAAG